MAAVAADLPIRGLLQRERAARLQNRGDGQGITFVVVLYELVNAVFPDQPAVTSSLQNLQRAVQVVLVDRLIDLGNDASAVASVRALAEEYLAYLASRSQSVAAANREDAMLHAHGTALHRRITAFLERRDRDPQRAPSLSSPPGSPIGSGR